MATTELIPLRYVGEPTLRDVADDIAVKSLGIVFLAPGHVPVLVMQPLEDPMSPAQVGRILHKMLGDGSTYVEVPHCGHAMLPEQPEIITREVVRFLHDIDR